MNAVRLILLLILFLPLLSRAQQQEMKLSTLSGEAFTKWLTGTEWRGEKDGKGAHLWFATPGIVIVRWEVNPGVWDCRAAALIPGEKGQLKWRWNPDSPASCTCAVAEDLKTLALEDGLLGKWTLAVSVRKPCVVTGGKLATMGAAGFSAWLEKQGLRWRDAKLNFSKGRTATYEGYAPGKFEIVSPGVVEVYPLAERSGGLLVIFSPALDGALIYAHWGVSGAKVKGAPDTAVIPAPVFNDPAPEKKTLAAMSKQEFEQWLVGTEWELTEGTKVCWEWFAAERFMTWRFGGEHHGFGYEVTGPGTMEWCYKASTSDKNVCGLSSLTTATRGWGGKTRATFKLLARRMPFPMHAPPVEKMKEMIGGLRIELDQGVHLTMPSSTKMLWHGGKGAPGEWNMTIPGPGMLLYSLPQNRWDSGLFVFREPTKARLYWIWGTRDSPVNSQAITANVTPDNAGGLFDMGLDETKAIPMKNPTAAVNALVVMDLGGGRTAGALSKLSLTSLALTTQDAATIAFNQPVGADMKKALREVTRFHGIRQQGWPRGQKMELSFADKYSPKDGPSAAVACALLLESALRGVALRPEFAVTGDMNADGSVQPIGGVAAKLRGATKGGCTIVAIPEKNFAEAADLALTDGAAPFLGIQVFTISHFDDAVKLAVSGDARLQAVLDSFTAISAKIKATPAALRQPDTISALRNLAKEAPGHASIRLLLAMAEDKLPATLSPAGSLLAIELAITDALEGTSQELIAKSNLDRGKVSSARGRLQQLRAKLDKRTHALTDAWITWCQSVERLTGLTGKVDDRLAKEHQAAISGILTEEQKLRANADFREDLAR